jgi:hypothetical protein
MALGRSGSQRIDIPHEPGQWMAFQRLGALELDTRTAPDGDLCADGWMAMKPGERFALCLRWLEACLVGWSYDAPLDADTRALLDAPTLLWAYLAAVTHNYEAVAVAKEPSSSPSTAISTTSPEPDAPIGGDSV